VQLPALAAWAWIPIVIWAAFAQTVRNAAQRSLTAEVGTLAATLVRFLYGLPFAALWVAALYLLAGAPAPALPAFGAPYFAWVLLGAVAQLAATAFLLAAMKERNFIVAVTYSKTEVLQVALFATLFLHELPGWLSALAMGVATLGVLLLSLPKAAPAGIGSTGWVSRAAGYGLASGAGFALSAVGYRGAALALDSGSPLLTGAWGVLWAQAIQSLLLGGYLAWRQPRALMAIARSWRLSTLAGMMGALASIGWFTAFSLRPATDVRTLGLVEVLFSYLVSRRIFHEKLGTAERVGLALVLAGLVGVCAQL
jgi:drug/metabolite transporter (DMT)-like permease